MAPLFTPLHPLFVCEVAGIDLRRKLSGDEVVAIEKAMDRHAVLVFRDQRLDDAQQLAFSRNFGEIERAVGGTVTKDRERRLGMEMADISNLDKSGRVLARDHRKRLFNLANELWHSDSSYKRVPAKYSLLSARAIPDRGGNTEFADMRAAYDALDAETKVLVDGIVVEHSVMYSRQLFGFTTFDAEERRMFAPVLQSLVRVHPVTGRRSLFLSAHAGGFLGWEMPEARALLRELTEHATQRDFVYSHVWRQFDLVMWDNRQTMHRARRYPADQARDMRRTTVAGDAPTVPQPLPTEQETAP